MGIQEYLQSTALFDKINSEFADGCIVFWRAIYDRKIGISTKTD